MGGSARECRKNSSILKGLRLHRKHVMALNAYLHMKGQKAGEIRGSCTQKGREGHIVVIAAGHEIVSPRDAASGLASAKRQHKPFTITKEIDAASPRLYELLIGNEVIVEWTLQFWAPSTGAEAGSGGEVQRYTVSLQNAAIADIRFTMPNNRHPELARYAEFEEVSFSYERISWTWNEGGITAADDWRARA